MGRILVVWVIGVVCASLLALPVRAQDDVPCFRAHGDQEADQKILEAIKKPLPEGGLDFSETALEEIVAYLRDEFKLEIQFDQQAMENLGIDPSHPITVKLRNISLRAALRLMLKDLEMTYVISDGVLLLTTQEEADSTFFVVIYPIGDLVEPATTPPNGASAWADYDVLIGAITECVSPDCWRENGGRGNIRRIGGTQIVVRQTQTVHEEIRNTLAAIRRAKQYAEQNQPAAKPAEVGSEAGFGGRGAAGGFGRGFGEVGGGGFGRGGFEEGGGFGGGRTGRETPPREKEQDADPFAE